MIPALESNPIVGAREEPRLTGVSYIFYFFKYNFIKTEQQFGNFQSEEFMKKFKNDRYNRVDTC
jgi:hypothetical protein